ncbi:MAG: hypothetical protein IAE86_11430 [Burkholderiaceae bacterium]|nr:hypothetical protein [Burkholderiaceae bacterium]
MAEPDFDRSKPGLPDPLENAVARRRRDVALRRPLQGRPTCTVNRSIATIRLNRAPGDQSASTSIGRW